MVKDGEKTLLKEVRECKELLKELVRLKRRENPVGRWDDG